MPAQHITPPKGFDVEVIHWRVEDRAAEIDGVEETSVDEKRVRDESERAAHEGEADGGLRSRIETLAPCWRSMVEVARPRPDEPPERTKVLPWIFIMKDFYS